MDCTTESEEADAVMLRKPAQVSADPLSALFPPLTDRQIEEYAKYLGPAAAEDRAWGVYVGIKNLNSQGEDPFRPEDLKPKPSVVIGVTVDF